MQHVIEPLVAIFTDNTSTHLLLYITDREWHANITVSQNIHNIISESLVK
jgi:hypothetical protein